MFFSPIFATAGVAILTLLIFGLFKWFEIPTGNIVDWIIGLASFYWLLAVVTIPWNIHFRAKEVLEEARISKKRGITVENESVNYTAQVERNSFIIAIILHLTSALALYFLAVTGISNVGYFSSIATLLLTFLRPAIRLYKYILYRLITIQQAIQYPREDIVTLVERVKNLETYQTQTQENQTSLSSQVQVNREDLIRLQTLLEQLKVKNQVEHENLSTEAKQYMAQLTEDSQFLSHVKEIIQFFKKA